MIPSPDAKGSQRIDEVITQRENQFRILCCCRQHRPSLHYLYSEMQKATISHDFFLQYTVPQLPPTGAGRFIRQFARTCISIQECPIVHRPPGTKMVSGAINLLVVSCTGAATTDRSGKKGHESISEDLPPLLFLPISSSIKRPGPRKGEGGPSQALGKVGKLPAAKN